MNVDTISQVLQTSKTFDKVYTKSVILKGELCSAEMQSYITKNYGNKK